MTGDTPGKERNLKEPETFVPTDHTGEIREVLEFNHIAIPEGAAEKLSAFENAMLDVNRYMNLTAIKEPYAVALKHFADSLSILPYLPENARIIDIGSGAGFPALPVAICRPDLRVIALDGTEKRVRFLRETIASVGIPNVGAMTGRAETVAKDPSFREQFDAVTARAVARLNVLCELCLPYVRVGGRFLAMKSLLAEEERKEAKKAIHMLGGKFLSEEKLTLSWNGETLERSVVIIEKIRETDDRYPRDYAAITKKPL